MKTHPLRGYEILSEIESLQELPVGARWHHERYDGKGYPDGISGEKIPLFARIIAVADSYDTMTSNRSYRKYLPQNVVREEIEKNIGTQFDPIPAKIMLEIIDSDTEYRLHE
ncbi:HD domain-containing phosphohydrolase [Ruminococcus sp. NK3A76]|uniref:HD domain-containing phosphohydrolase n=1 Tax=Ruminococcus sp. NK3A76 TaxID=877411 RepID=UPI000A012EC9